MTAACRSPRRQQPISLPLSLDPVPNYMRAIPGLPYLSPFPHQGKVYMCVLSFIWYSATRRSQGAMAAAITFSLYPVQRSFVKLYGAAVIVGLPWRLTLKSRECRKHAEDYTQWDEMYPTPLYLHPSPSLHRCQSPATPAPLCSLTPHPPVPQQHTLPISRQQLHTITPQLAVPRQHLLTTVSPATALLSYPPPPQFLRP